VQWPRDIVDHAVELGMFVVDRANTNAANASNRNNQYMVSTSPERTAV
jgi:hypothetical protein